jgi:hypothetical protein
MSATNDKSSIGQKIFDSENVPNVEKTCDWPVDGVLIANQSTPVALI